jgi:hypothetical protein
LNWEYGNSGIEIRFGVSSVVAISAIRTWLNVWMSSVQGPGSVVLEFDIQNFVKGVSVFQDFSKIIQI